MKQTTYRGRPIRTDEELITAIRAESGDLTSAAAALGMSRKMLYQRVHGSERLTAITANARRGGAFIRRLRGRVQICTMCAGQGELVKERLAGASQTGTTFGAVLLVKCPCCNGLCTQQAAVAVSKRQAATTTPTVHSLRADPAVGGSRRVPQGSDLKPLSPDDLQYLENSPAVFITQGATRP